MCNSIGGRSAVFNVLPVCDPPLTYRRWPDSYFNATPTLHPSTAQTTHGPRCGAECNHGCLPATVERMNTVVCDGFEQRVRWHPVTSARASSNVIKAISDDATVVIPYLFPQNSYHSVSPHGCYKLHMCSLMRSLVSDDAIAAHPDQPATYRETCSRLQGPLRTVLCRGGYGITVWSCALPAVFALVTLNCSIV